MPDIPKPFRKKSEAILQQPIIQALIIPVPIALFIWGMFKEIVGLPSHKSHGIKNGKNTMSIP
jgi:hypothetical protein